MLQKEPVHSLSLISGSTFVTKKKDEAAKRKKATATEY